MDKLSNRKSRTKLGKKSIYYIKWILCVFSLALIFPCYSATTQSKNKTCKGSFQKDSDYAFGVCIREAIKGDAYSQYSIGIMYVNGDGEIDYKKAFTWFTKAADNGHIEALLNLSAMHTLGEVVPKNLNKAFELNLKAAVLGNTIAQNNVGLCYEIGSGTSIDLKESFYWYSKAAESGMDSAQNALGYFYLDGKFVPKDVTKAFEWHLKSANQGYLGSVMRIANMHLEGIGVDKNEKKSFDWYLKAAEQDYGAAQFMVGSFFENGIGVPKDLKLALHYYTLAVYQGETIAIEERDRVKKELEKDDSKKQTQGNELILVCSLMFDTELILTHRIDLKNYKVNGWNAYISDKTIKWTTNEYEFRIDRYSGRHDGLFGENKRRVTGKCKKMTSKLF